MLPELQPYFRVSKLPHIWCPGCGNGIIMKSVVQAIKKLGWDQDKTVVVSGIGCSSRATGYLDFNTLHTTHGRALAFATGIKLARPELHVMVLTGDGDSSAIGGNHLIHAARRNIDLTTIVFNNQIYGMTGGQYSPLTPVGSLAATAPYGMVERSFDLCRLAEAAGATYVARATTYHTRQLTDLIAKAAEHKGFSFVEAVTMCPVQYGRKNSFATATAMLRWQRDHAVAAQAAAKLGPDEMAEKFVIGELFKTEAPEYTDEYQKVIDRAMAQEPAEARAEGDRLGSIAG